MLFVAPFALTAVLVQRLLLRWAALPAWEKPTAKCMKQQVAHSSTVRQSSTKPSWLPCIWDFYVGQAGPPCSAAAAALTTAAPVIAAAISSRKRQSACRTHHVALLLTNTRHLKKGCSIVPIPIVALRHHQAGGGGSKGRSGTSHLALQRTASMPAAAFALPQGFQVLQQIEIRGVASLGEPVVQPLHYYMRVGMQWSFIALLLLASIAAVPRIPLWRGTTRLTLQPPGVDVLVHS